MHKIWSVDSQDSISVISSTFVATGCFANSVLLLLLFFAQWCKMPKG